MAPSDTIKMLYMNFRSPGNPTYFGDCEMESVFEDGQKPDLA
jgi:hypothetical protein